MGSENGQIVSWRSPADAVHARGDANASGGHGVLFHALTVSAIAFALHFVWEFAQCELFFEHITYPVGIGAMAWAAVGDVALTWLIYGVVALAWRRWTWGQRQWTAGQWALMLGIALALAVGVELRALANDTWRYTELAPRLPGTRIALVPLLQLLLLTPLTLAFARAIAGPPLEREPAADVAYRYDRIAPVYDIGDAMMELGFAKHRPSLFAGLEGQRVLEIGVGTGKNIPYYPPADDTTGTDNKDTKGTKDTKDTKDTRDTKATELTAIDISEGMLSRARTRAARLGRDDVAFLQADAEALPFADDSFDAVVTACVFCSVPDPVMGLEEARRVLRPGGRLVMLEHVLSETPVLRGLMRWFDPMTAGLWGAHIARDTVANVRAAGFEQIRVQKLIGDVFLRIEARSPSTA